MRIEKMLLQNYCQHQYTELAFSPGMNVIVGPIGAGKSNILKAIRFVFTNDSGNPGNRESDISFNIAPGERSGVHLFGEHEQKRFLARRMLAPNSRDMQLDGGPVLRSEKDIAEELKTKLGIDPSLFDEFVIVPQGQLAGVLDMKDARRTETMHGLQGLNKYAKLYSWFSPYLTALAAPTAVLDVKAAKASLDECLANKAKYEAQIAELEKNMPEANRIAEAQAVCDSKSLVTSLHQSISDDKLRKQQCQELIAKARDGLEEKCKQADSLKDSLVKASEQRQALEADCRKAMDQKARKVLEDRCAALSVPAPELKFSGSGYIPPNTDLVATERQSLAIVRHVHNLLKTNPGACPTCLRPMEQKIEDVTEHLKGLEQIIKSHDEAVSASRKFDNEWAVHTANEARRLAELPKAQAMLAVTPIVEYSGPDLEELDKSLIKLREYIGAATASYTQITADCDARCKAILVQSSISEELDSQIADNEAKLAAASSVSFESHTEASMLLDIVASLKKDIAEAQGSLKVIEEQLPYLTTQHTRAIESSARYARSQEYSVIAQSARELFHRDKLPAELAKAGMVALADQMNKSLSGFNANFRLHAGVGSSFMTTFYNDERKGSQPDVRLSGGERAQFGLALRVASHTLWAHSLGFLAMDEPTYGFGQNDMDCVRIAINQLRDLSVSQGLQVIVVTHEKALLNLFDNVIQVGV